MGLHLVTCFLSVLYYPFLFLFTFLTGITQSKAKKKSQFDAQKLRSGESIPNCILYNQAFYEEAPEWGQAGPCGCSGELPSARLINIRAITVTETQ